MNTETTARKTSFTLSKSNKIYLLIIIVLVAAANIWFVMQLTSSGGASQDAAAEMTGQLIFSILLRYVMLPSLFGYVVWWIRGRKEKAGTTTFNIVVTLILLIEIIGLLVTTGS